jgi:hypothetical protein
VSGGRGEFYAAADRIAAAIDSLPANTQDGAYRQLAQILNTYARYTAEAAALHQGKHQDKETNQP